MRESALQRPHFTQTKLTLAMMRDRETGGLTGQWGEENGEESEEEVGGTHCCVVESVLTLE